MIQLHYPVYGIRVAGFVSWVTYSHDGSHSVQLVDQYSYLADSSMRGEDLIKADCKEEEGGGEPAVFSDHPSYL